MLLVVLGWVGLSYLQLVFSFDKRLGGTPSRLYSAPLVLEPGAAWSRNDLERALQARGYRLVGDLPAEGGQYSREGRGLLVHLRAFPYGTETVPGYLVSLELTGGRLRTIRLGRRGQRLDMALVEPRPLDVFRGDLNEHRERVRWDQLPEHLLEAVVTVEDRRFWTHRGLDPRGIGRALWQDLRSGEIEQGGSTITQQVIKNVMLHSRRRLGRKLREAVMAPLLEMRLAKHEILEVYLNEIYMGQKGPLSIVGMGAAARFYFAVDADRLTLGQAALLAGLIRSPGQYNPWLYPDRARQRRDLVLELMAGEGQITRAEARAAQQQPIRLHDGLSEPLPEAGTFLDVVRAQIGESFSRDSLEGDGLSIYTTLDTRVQTAAARALADTLTRLEAAGDLARDDPAARLQGAVVVVNPDTGAVLAMVGDRRPGRGRFNRAVDAMRPVGSLFKPLVYLAAVEAGASGRRGGLTEASVLQDEPLEIVQPGGVWKPSNSDGRFRGPVSLRRALADSINIPAVRTARDLGIERVVRKAESAGFPRGLPRVPAVALGAAEAAPLDVAVAYSVLAAGGQRPQSRFWDEIRSADGVLLDAQPAEATPAATAQAAFVITQLLAEAVRTGTGRQVADSAFTGAVAGKTGTTNQKRDAWFVGYMPGFLAVVWVGADDNRPVGLSGARGALPVWLDLMTRLQPGRPASFPVPDGVVEGEWDPETGGRAVAGCVQRQKGWFIEGTEPGEDCRQHRKGFWRRLFRR